MYKPISHILHSFLLLVLIGTYGSVFYYLKTAPSDPPARISTPIPTPAPTLPPTTLPVPGTSGTTEAVPDTGWERVQRGLERRVITIYAEQQPVETMYIWRLDQKYFRLNVAFDERPKSLDAWQKETGADLVMNGGYFSIENERYFPDGLIIQNGEVSGRSFAGFGGMLAVDERGAELRWLVEQPYQAGERLQAALQAFPILVRPGGRLGFGPEREDHARARRTVIAQDLEGRMLLIVTPQGHFTLHELSTYLTGSDLRLDIALNLDGGGSTGLLVAEPRELIPARVLLPYVILVHAR